MAQSLSPFFRSPFTDVTGGMVSHQLLGRCQQHEKLMMDCLEAYGLDRGMKKCTKYLDDFKECQMLTKQFKRFIALRDERDRQIAAGILKDDEKYLNPRVDSY